MVGGAIATYAINFELVSYKIVSSILLVFRTNSSSQYRRVSHVFAQVHWYQFHLRENRFNHPRILVVSPDFDVTGPSMFIPLSRIFAIVSDSLKFDNGYDNVLIATLLSHKYFI